MPEPNALTVSQPPATKPPVTASFFPKGGLVPDTFESLWRLSDVFAASSMVPKQMIGKPADVFVAIQMGLELNLSPMQALQNIAVINGRPSLWGDAVIALVRASGRLEEFDEYFEGQPYQDNYQAVCVLKRQGDKKQIRREFSVADAKMAGLWSKEGPWKQYPKRMLQMRARSWALRDGFGDVLRGVRTAEEMMDEPPAIEMRPVPAAVVSYEPDVPRVDMELRWTVLRDAATAAGLKVSHEVNDQLRSFVTETADANECHEADLIDQAVGNIAPFMEAFQGWRKANGYIKDEPKKGAKHAGKTDAGAVERGGEAVDGGGDRDGTVPGQGAANEDMGYVAAGVAPSEAEQLEISVRELIDSVDDRFLNDLAKAGVKPELTVRVFIHQGIKTEAKIRELINDYSKLKVADIAEDVRKAVKRFGIA